MLFKKMSFKMDKNSISETWQQETKKQLGRDWKSDNCCYWKKRDKG